MDDSMTSREKRQYLGMIRTLPDQALAFELTSQQKWAAQVRTIGKGNAQRAAEKVPMVEAEISRRSARDCSICRRSHGPEIRHESE